MQSVARMDERQVRHALNIDLNLSRLSKLLYRRRHVIEEGASILREGPGQPARDAMEPLSGRTAGDRSPHLTTDPQRSSGA